MEIQDINQNQEEDVPIPKIIGLTGGIGSGKTSVAKLLRKKVFLFIIRTMRRKI
jgi:dephospho-CoA kinase